MKRGIALVLVLVLVIAFAGCGATTSVKTGLGIATSIAKSTDFADEFGQVQVDTIIAAVSVDGDGKILSVSIDAAQTRVRFDEAGAIISDKTAEVPTKLDLGADYNMKRVSGIGREWDEQIAELEKWMVGKTAAEISGMALTDGKMTDSDMTSKVTVTVTDYQKVVLEAIQNAK